MFTRAAISAAAAIAALASAPAAADAALIVGGADQSVRQQDARGTARAPRPEPLQRAERSCRRGDTGSLLGAIAGGLIGRQMSLAPDPRATRSGRRACR